MTGRIIVQSDSGRRIHIGGALRPAGGHPLPRFSLFKTPSWPKPRPSCDYSSKAKSPLAEMWANDQWGDCCDVAAFRNSAVKLCNADDYGSPYSADDVLGLYARNTGFDPKDPSTDNGTDPVSMLNYIKAHGLLPDGSHKIEGWMAIDGGDPEEVFSAIDVFEGLITACELPTAWYSPPPMGNDFVFDVAGDPNPDDGHAMFLVDYPDLTKAHISTWGMEGFLTTGAMQKYFTPPHGGMYIAITKDMLTKAESKAPNGLDWPALEAALKGYQR